jgi:transcription-repair coupling factor (superfamily II helicase)
MYFSTMPIKPLSDKWSEKKFPCVSQWLDSRPDVAVFSGLSGSADAFVIADLFTSSNKTAFVFVENGKRAESLAQECATLLGQDCVLFYPSRDAVPYNMKSPFGPITEARFNVLAQLLGGKKRVIVSVHASLLQKIPPPRDLFNKIIRLHAGDAISIETLSAWLIDIGFRRESMVQDLGTFCIRGGIVDLYPFLGDGPIRLEFFGDTIESIREFDVFSQKSKATKPSLEIFPMRELFFDNQTIERALASLEQLSQKQPGLTEAIRKLSHQWKTVSDLEGIEWFLHWFSLPEASILDYAPQDALIIWDDLLPPIRRFEECVQNYTRHLERVPALFAPLVSTPEQLLIAGGLAEEYLSQFSQIFMDTSGAAETAAHIQIACSEQPLFPQNLEPLLENLTMHHRAGEEIILVCGNTGHAERLLEMIGEACPFAQVVTGFLARGFIDKYNKRVIYTDAQIFNRPPTRQIGHKKFSAGQSIPSFDALAPGDHVVHIDHGIGAFLGIERVSAGGSSRDCMVLLYQDRAKLYVPVEDFHKVQKYIGKESLAPSLSKLGSASWDKLKQKTRESLKEMAQDLIDLYAKRQYGDGIQFSPDSLWQKEFEDSFVYEETADQLRAIKETKLDMEAPKPMDRLICGDVGFGKTEVAMRAAFKAVMDGYQVALLAPTTILAAQHYATLKERLADFPVKSAVLSRFLKPKEQKNVIAGIVSGDIAICVGTHRILSQDVVFKNLGLLIIDEEQRFGVQHKEKLKKFRSKVDVLSMTATPIPRTLHMSLIGARDLSIINTPPRNRLPIETHVMEYRDEIVGTAIENELERGGQVFVVHNRIQGLSAMKDKIEQMVPRARVICAHGQMHEGELEPIMKEFIAGRFDVLVSTVIIENGIDIPNVNTIIVIRADAMGLSQLYQLRGRVGRSSEQAYAYFLTPPNREARELALRRLKALEQYTDLGSGFQIAMRDLEIRGAGNILGTMQHGFIAAVGFEMYCTLLEEAVKELRGEPIVKRPGETSVDIAIEAFIPADYIGDHATRIAMYQRLSGAQRLEDVEDLEKELIDRFGSMPSSVHALLVLMRIKVLAVQAHCSKVSVSAEGVCTLTLEADASKAQTVLARLQEKSPLRFEITNTLPILLKTTLTGNSALEKALEVKNLLQ